MGGWTAALVCLLVLLGLEAVSRTVVADRAAGPTANQIAALDVALRQRTDPPSVLFLGGSHTQAGVAATRIEELLGWPHGSVLNASLSNASPRDVLGLYRRHRDLFRSAKTAYVAVDVTYFNRNALNRTSTPSPAWRRRASLADRLSFPGSLETRVDVVAGWFWNLWDQRTTWRQELIGLALRLRGWPGRARTGSVGRTRLRDHGLSADGARHSHRDRNCGRTLGASGFDARCATVACVLHRHRAARVAGDRRRRGAGLREGAR